MPRVVARSHPLVAAHQVPSCSPTSSCWCFAASPSSSWSSPSGSSPVRAASASGRSAPFSKVSGCLSPLVGPRRHSPWHVVWPPHPVCPRHAHLWHLAQPRAGTWQLARPCTPCTCVPCTHIVACIAQPPVCTLTPDGAALHTQPARRLLRASHASLHIRCIPCAHLSPALAPAAGLTHPSLCTPRVSPAHGSCRGHSGPLDMLWVPVAPLTVGTLLRSSPCSTGSGCCACTRWLCSELALPRLDPAPDAPLAHASTLPAG